MSEEGAAVIRPRTTGELLDDAWRLYFADAPVLLLLTGAFLAPAFGALLLLAALPSPSDSALRLLPPLLPLPLLVLTGLGSAACQEWLRGRAESKRPSFTGCLTAAARRGLAHVAARAAALASVLPGLGISLAALSLTDFPIWLRCFLAGAAWLPALLLWPLLAPAHAFLASGKAQTPGGFGEYVRLARYDPTKVGVVTLSRLALLALVFVNLHLLVEVGLEVLDSFAGFDAAFIAMQLTIANPVYDLTLALFSWLLLAPFFEASNFLTLVDARARREGLDLQVRVQSVFSGAERSASASWPSSSPFSWPGRPTPPPRATTPSIRPAPPSSGSPRKRRRPTRTTAVASSRNCGKRPPVLSSPADRSRGSDRISRGSPR